jgi:hypothetical protein
MYDKAGHLQHVGKLTFHQSVLHDWYLEGFKCHNPSTQPIGVRVQGHLDKLPANGSQQMAHALRQLARWP